jgi:hypothetical protein
MSARNLSLDGLYAVLESEADRKSLLAKALVI